MTSSATWAASGPTLRTLAADGQRVGHKGHKGYKGHKGVSKTHNSDSGALMTLWMPSRICGTLKFNNNPSLCPVSLRYDSNCCALWTGRTLVTLLISTRRQRSTMKSTLYAGNLVAPSYVSDNLTWC